MTTPPVVLVALADGDVMLSARDDDDAVDTTIDKVAVMDETADGPDAVVDVSAAEDELPFLSFANGLPGFPDAQRFVLVQWGGESSPFSVMRCVDADLQFVVMLPNEFFPGYEPEIDDDTVAALGLTSADDALVLVIVTIPDDVEHSTANLLGPIVVNRHSRRAAQAVLTETFSTREPIIAR